MASSTGPRRLTGGIDAGTWAGPFLIAAVCFFSFGLLLSRLGFFQDDWHHVFYAYWQGAAGLQRFLLADRGPFAWIVYASFFRILGFSPTAWHWSLMVIRLATALAFWRCFLAIWPLQRPLAGWLALIFAVYPIFTLQPLSVAYTLHWLMFLIYAVSLLLMLLAARRTRGFIWLTAGAVLFEVTHLAFIEYFAGLELARPIFLWLAYAGLPPDKRLRNSLRRAVPYLVVLLLYVVYRSSFATIFGYDRFATLAALGGLMRAPITGMASILQSALQDLVYILLSPWYSAVNPAIIELARPSTYVIFGSMVAFGALAWWAMSQAKKPTSGGVDDVSAAALAGSGLLAVVLAILPFWATGFSIFQKNLLWSERLALAAMPGASMLIVGIVYGLIQSSNSRNLALSVILGLSIGLHVQTARSYQASWDKQLDFYWQLHWRAPSMQPGTMLVSDQEILFYMGIYPTAFAINMLYPQVTEPPTPSYWFNAGSEHVNFDRFSAGETVTFVKYASRFTADPHHVVAITFEPGDGQCLWILSPKLENARGLSAEASTWLTISDPGLIRTAPESTPPLKIFGREPSHSWCYYFEKADLASQSEQWSAVRDLWGQAQQAGVRAANGVELVPFIEGFARLNDWSQARTLTLRAQSLPDRSTSVLCDLWRRLKSSTSASAARDQAVGEMEDFLGCQR